MKIKTLLQAALVVVLSTTLTTEMALAQKAGKKKEEDPATALDAQTSNILLKTQELLNQKQTAQARAKLGELKLDRLSPHERAVVEQYWTQMDLEEEKFPSARQHIQAALDSGGLNEKEVLDYKYMIAQTFIQEEKWAEGAKGIEEWMKVAPKVSGANYYLLAICYFQLEKVDQALPNAKKAVDLADKPNIPWIELYASLLLQKERFKEALPLFEKLLNAVPNKKSYWVQLAGIYTQMEDYKNALIIYQLANDAGLLTDAADFKQLASLLSNQEMPYNAATVLSKAIDDKKIQPDVKTWQDLGNSYIAAREYKKALPVLDKAAQLSDKGTEYAQIGDVNLQLQQWNAAEAAYVKALTKGGLRDANAVQLGLGSALFNQKKFLEAKAAMEKIPATSPQSKYAKSYLQAINAQIKTR